MTANPKITVYIAAHNCARFLTEAVESVLRQTSDQWELLIIDDNSSDNVDEVLAYYQGDPRVRILRTTGLGLPGVCNLALGQAQGDYLIRLDGDDVFDDNILLVLGTYLDRNPDVSLVFPDYYLVDEGGEVISLERRRRVYEHNNSLDMPPNGACTMIRRQVLLEIGGYREDLGAQDGFDLWNRLKKSYKSGNVNLPLFYYRRHRGNLTNNHYRILRARQEIKKSAALERLEENRPILAVIPCRRNYDFCLDLWAQKVNGRSLLETAVETCLATPLFDHVIVACDNPDAQEALAAYQDPRLAFFLRDRQDTIRSCSIAVTLEKILKQYDPEHRGVTVLNYLETPFVTPTTLEESVYTLVSESADSCFGMAELTVPIFQRGSHGFRLINPPKELSTDFDKVYRETNTFLATRNRNLSTGSHVGAYLVNFEVSEQESFSISSQRMLKLAVYSYLEDNAHQLVRAHLTPRRAAGAQRP